MSIGPTRQDWRDGGEPDRYALALAFDTDDPEFARGVEVGRLWEQLQAHPGAIVETVHVTNAEMVLRLAESQGRHVTGKEHNETWVTVRFDETGGVGRR